jgi:hypothetical protein
LLRGQIGIAALLQRLPSLLVANSPLSMVRKQNYRNAALAISAHAGIMHARIGVGEWPQIPQRQSSLQTPRQGAWLVGGGEMGRLIRALDWSQTPLGCIDRWPQSLRTAVGIALDSRHPIARWLGAARTMIYNDAYWPMLGLSKHPQFLGRSGQACWAEIWDIVGPMMDRCEKQASMRVAAESCAAFGHPFAHGWPGCASVRS